MITLLSIILATFLVSLLSFAGVFTLSMKENLLDKIIFYLVALSVGGLMGGAFIHLLPEAIESYKGENALLIALVGFFIFFIIEKTIHWRHCHKGHCEKHTFAHMNLIGDSIHNFLDGLIIAASFIVSPAIGITSTIAIAMHEIPQELGDFGVLIYSGMTRKKALILNFITALTAVIGGIFGFYLSSNIDSISPILLLLASGGFIYIAATDLIPEIRKETNTKKSIINFLIIILGIFIMYLLKVFGVR